MKKIYGILLLLLILTACNFKKQPAIQGKLSDKQQDYIYLYEILPQEKILLDSCKLETGAFYFNPKIETIGFYQLALTPENNILLILEPNSPITVQASTHSLVKTAKISGALETEKIRTLDAMLELFVQTVDSLIPVYERAVYQDSVREFVEQTYLELIQQHRENLDVFLAENPTSLAQIPAFYQRFNKRKFYDEIEDLPILKAIYFRLQEQYSDNIHVLFLKERIETIESQS